MVRRRRRRATLALVQYTPEQAEEWKRRAPEPIILDIPGWKKEEHAHPSLPNFKLTVWERDTSRIEMGRHWDQPLLPGRPMVVGTSRKVVVSGHSEEIHRTSMFEGAAMEVEVLFLQGPGWSVRFVFDECPQDIVDDVCARIRIVP
jgi:hypothetical protein